MAIIILPVCFIAILLNMGLYAGPQVKKREILLGSVLVFSTSLLVITEVLSAFHSLNFSWIFTCWSLITLAVLFNLFKNRPAVYAMANKHRQKILFTYQRITLIQKLLMLFVCVLLLLVFAQGLIYPPNNWDSMTYHLARIVSWVSHESVSFYPTHIIRQLYQPPFAEYTIMHFAVLDRGDYFSNAVQFLYFLFSIITITGITQQLGLNRIYQTIAALLAATIPEVLLQASSTQNDVVVSFFILSACYFAIRSVKKNHFSYYLFFGLSAGLALLTKGTAYLYLAPILLLFGIVLVTNAVKYRSFSYVGYGLIACLLLTGLNTVSYVRNYNFNGSFLGADKIEAQNYANERMSAGLLLSSVIKNSSLHLSIKHTGFIADGVDKTVSNLHNLIGVNINDTAVNYYGMPFSSKSLPTFEDSAPNPVHYVLLLLSVIILLVFLVKNRLPAVVALLYAVIILQILFFCAYLKWQPWHSRLHVPLFMLAIPLVCYAISIKALYRKVFYVCIPVLLLYALAVVCFNSIRPFNTNALLTADISVFSPRYQKYFAAKPELYIEYKAVTEKMQQLKMTNIGLITGIDEWVYPLFTHCFSTPVNPVYIDVQNTSKNLKTDTAKLDGIVVFRGPHNHIVYEGKRYHNQTKNNTVLLYK